MDNDGQPPDPNKLLKDERLTQEERELIKRHRDQQCMRHQFTDATATNVVEFVPSNTRAGQPAVPSAVPSSSGQIPTTQQLVAPMGPTYLVGRPIIGGLGPFPGAMAPGIVPGMVPGAGIPFPPPPISTGFIQMPPAPTPSPSMAPLTTQERQEWHMPSATSDAANLAGPIGPSPPAPSQTPSPQPDAIALFREVLTQIGNVSSRSSNIEAQIKEYAENQAAIMREMQALKTANEAKASSSASTSQASARDASPHRGAANRLLKSQNINRPITADDLTAAVQNVSIGPVANAPGPIAPPPQAAPDQQQRPPAPAARAQGAERDRLLKEQLATLDAEDRRIVLADPTTLTHNEHVRRRELYNLRNRTCINCREKGHTLPECDRPCGLCAQPNHRRHECPQKRCANCDQAGHELKACTLPCGACGSTEHKKPNCKKPKEQKPPQPPKKDDKSGTSGSGGAGPSKGADSKKPPPPPPPSGRGRGESSNKGSSKRSNSRRRKEGSELAKSSGAMLSQQIYFKKREETRNNGSARSSSIEPAKRAKLAPTARQRSEVFGFRYKPLYHTKRVKYVYGNGLAYFVAWSCHKMALGILIKRKEDYGLDKDGRELLHPTIVQFGFESFQSIMNVALPTFDVGDVVIVKSYVPIQTRNDPNTSYRFRNPKDDLSNLLNSNNRVDPDALALEFALSERSHIAKRNQLMANVKCDVHVENLDYAYLSMLIAGTNFERGHEVRNANISDDFDLAGHYNWRFVLTDYFVAPALEFCRLGQLIVPAAVAEEITPLQEPFKAVYNVKSVPPGLMRQILDHGNFGSFGLDPRQRTNVFTDLIKPAMMAACCAERLDDVNTKRLAKVEVEILHFRAEHVLVLKVTPTRTSADYIQAILREYKPVSDLTLFHMVKDEATGKDMQRQICRLRTLEIFTGPNDMITQMNCRRVIDIDHDRAISPEMLTSHYRLDNNLASDQMWWEDKHLPKVGLFAIPRLTDISADHRIEFLNLLDVDTTVRTSANQKSIINSFTGVPRPRVAWFEQFMDMSREFPEGFEDMAVFMAHKTEEAARRAAEQDAMGRMEASDSQRSHSSNADESVTVGENVEIADDDVLDEDDELGQVSSHSDSPNEEVSDEDEAMDDEEPEEARIGGLSDNEELDVRDEQRLIRDEDSDRTDYLRSALGVLTNGGPKNDDPDLPFICLHLVETLREDPILHQHQKEVLCELVVDEAPQTVVQAPFGTGKTQLITTYDRYLGMMDNNKPIFKDTNLLIVAEVNGAVDKIAEEILGARRIMSNLRREEHDPGSVLVYKSESILAQDDLTVIVEKPDDLRQWSSITEHAKILLKDFAGSLDTDTKDFLVQYIQIRTDFRDVITNDGKVLNLVLMYNTRLKVVICTRALACASDGILQWTNRVAFDEASQIRHIDALLLVVNMPNLVQTFFAGDVKQLGPFISFNFQGRLMNVGQQSVLSYLALHQPKCFHLTVTHRCGRDMAGILAKTIYRNNLESSRYETPLFHTMNLPVARELHPVVLVHSVGKSMQLPSKSWRNTSQCNVACEIVAAILKHRGERKLRVAVLCVYTGDAMALQDMLTYYSNTYNELFESLTVESIRSYMGNENDFTILVTGRESGGSVNLSRDTPFPLLPNPFVVAVTRARELTYIIGNMDFLVSQSGSIMEKFIMEVAKNAPPVLDEWYIPYLKSKNPDIPPTYHPTSKLLVTQRGTQFVDSFVAQCIPANTNGYSAKALGKITLQSDFSDLAGRLAQLGNL